MNQNVFKVFRTAIMLMATAMGVIACGPPQEMEDALIIAQEFEDEASATHSEFFSTIQNLVMRDNVVDLTPYIQLRDEVVNHKTDVLSKLAKYRTQEEVDSLRNGLPDYPPKNDAKRDEIMKLVDANQTMVAINKFKRKCQNVEKKKTEVNALLELVNEEHGDESYEEEREAINDHLAEGNKKLRSIHTSITGFSNKLEAKRDEINAMHAEIIQLLADRDKAIADWVEPPPAPEAPEKVLFTVETTPAVYEKLLMPLMQNYKHYTRVYVSEQTGNHCVTDSENKEGVVFRLVEPEQMLDGKTADVVIAFREAFPADKYAKYEEQASANMGDLNSVIVSGMAYNALVFKASEQNPLNSVTTSRIDTQISGNTVYVGSVGSLDKELFDTLLKDKGITTQAVDEPVTQGIAAKNTLAAVAFSRTGTPGKELQVARTPAANNVYFTPTVGNIAADRYAYSTCVNAVLQQESSGYTEARNFLSYVLSADGQKVVKSTGFVSRDEYDEDTAEMKHLRKMFLDRGYTIGRILTYDTFLFPKNDTRISKNPVVTDRKTEFQEFDSSIRSNFGHIADVLKKSKSKSGLIAVGIIGHASSEGGNSINLPLSINRAKYTGACIKEQAVVKLLLTDGMSAEVPVDTNDEESGRVRNRRATAYVLEVFEIGKEE